MLAQVVPCASAIGGGALPGETLPSFAIGLESSSPDELARQLRHGATPVIGRIADGRLLLDVRTVLEDQDEMLIEAVHTVMRNA
jgi:L-seryl-tRNA(Ser) seleniumtransferase